MEEPLYLTLFQPDDARESAARILETPVEAATTDGQAVRQNELAEHGRSQTLLAGKPLYWQRKLARALVVGFAAGVLVSIIIAVIF